MNLLFTPTAQQYGPQGFCAGAIDNTNVQSEPWCITFLVGFSAPNLQTPNLVQGSASPIGTVFANQTIFSIQSKIIIMSNNNLHSNDSLQVKMVSLSIDQVTMEHILLFMISILLVLLSFNMIVVGHPMSSTLVVPLSSTLLLHGYLVIVTISLLIVVRIFTQNSSIIIEPSLLFFSRSIEWKRLLS